MGLVTLTGIILFGYPMYSGWWIAFAGITFMWHNIWMLVLPVINWIIMTITLINSEEKWLLDLFFPN